MISTFIYDFALEGFCGFREVDEYEYPGWQLLFYCILWSFVGLCSGLLVSTLSTYPFWEWREFDSQLLIAVTFGSGLITFLRSGGLFINRLKIKEFKPFLRWLWRALRP
ncbi:MAG: hypothetical protein Q4A31_10905 [Corynebacterium sp.]|uniref:hypothetical protein n=1 Tax=Corynebacterium sp. TaxID=1720 RepID=UPI0026DAC5F2|nr:hypothetical protein [Corynebacterium sp.]MDO4762418.1 hypothetical protein [Corynebacterium sp.]